MRKGNLRRSASSRSLGLLVAAMINLPPSDFDDCTPSIWTRNSVFILRDDSFSFSDLFERIESISSKKMTDGLNLSLIEKSARTLFSLSPTHLPVSDEAEIAKNLRLHSWAIALAIIVFPFPGGPNRSIPFIGWRIPSKRSGLFSGRITLS